MLQLMRISEDKIQLSAPRDPGKTGSKSRRKSPISIYRDEGKLPVRQTSFSESQEKILLRRPQDFLPPIKNVEKFLIFSLSYSYYAQKSLFASSGSSQEKVRPI